MPKFYYVEKADVFTSSHLKTSAKPLVQQGSMPVMKRTYTTVLPSGEVVTFSDDALNAQKPQTETFEAAFKRLMHADVPQPVSSLKQSATSKMTPAQLMRSGRWS